MNRTGSCVFFFFFNDTATTEIYTLSLHDALPISLSRSFRSDSHTRAYPRVPLLRAPRPRRRDRKSTRLNSSHQIISYAVFCLKKKKKDAPNTDQARPLQHIEEAVEHRAEYYHSGI